LGIGVPQFLIVVAAGEAGLGGDVGGDVRDDHPLPQPR
jgi:hypothetical protein